MIPEWQQKFNEIVAPQTVKLVPWIWSVELGGAAKVYRWLAKNLRAKSSRKVTFSPFKDRRPNSNVRKPVLQHNTNCNPEHDYMHIIFIYAEAMVN